MLVLWRSDAEGECGEGNKGAEGWKGMEDLLCCLA